MAEFLRAHVSSELLIALGIGVLLFIVWLLKKLGASIITQIKEAMRDQQSQLRKEYLEAREEREYDNYLLLRGMQVITDLDHELVHCVMTGTHNGGLERANRELEQFRQLSNENIVKKAARWNLKIDN